MTQAKHKISLSCSLLTSVLSVIVSATSAYGVSLTNSIIIPGESTDLSSSSGNNSANVNRLGGFFSDIYYDRYKKVYYGLADRGPGGGVISYETRVQKFSLGVDSNTGAISQFKLLDTIKFTKSGENYNGLNKVLPMVVAATT